MSFRQLVAYGNSDQVSFRSLDVQKSFDVLTVPGTIASYYSEATAAFVLSIQKPYVIDPRTPLFQGELASPRASHFTLADWHGPRVRDRLVPQGSSEFTPSFWSRSVVDEMVSEIIGRQRNYANSAPLLQTKLDRYAKLLAEAMHEQGASPPAQETNSPYAVLAPYFAVAGTADPWWSVMQDVWAACGSLEDPRAIVPVLCVDGRPKANGDGGATMAALLPELPDDLSTVCFYWVTNFDERKASEDQLQEMWDTIQSRPDGRRLVNMYGGFFSICLRHAGLRGFGNGLTYSESRDWPALASTGAAPPRYYVRELHAFLSPAMAAALCDSDGFFECPCAACSAWRDAGQSVASLPYHDLKRHFALARSWELEETASTSLNDVATKLRVAQARLVAASEGNLVLRGTSAAFLGRWAKVLEAQ